MIDDATRQTLAQAEALRKEGHHAACADLVQTALSNGVVSLDLHRILAEALFDQARFAEALPSLQICLREWGHKCPFGLYEKAITCVNKTYASTVDRTNFWEESSHSTSRDLDESISLVIGGHYDLAREKFSDACSHIFKDNEVIEIWKGTFNLIIDSDKNGSVEMDVLPLRIKKILVSGYGWSGSGAIFDYLSEFDEVAALSVEAPHLKSTSGLLGLLAAADDPEKFKEKSYLFLTRMLIGRGLLWDERAFGDYIRTSQVLLRQNQIIYAMNSRDVVALLLRATLECEKNGFASHETLSLIADQIANKIMIGDKAPKDGKSILLDNIIHSNDAILASYLCDTLMICSFRDARSNFVSMKRELSTYLDDGRRFALGRKDWMVNVLKGYEDAEKAASLLDGFVLEKVYFEDFVLSEKVRQNIIKLAGLDTSGHRKYEHFRPWESLRNVLAHLEWDNQEDIRAIEQTIPEQCVDLIAVPMQPNARA